MEHGETFKWFKPDYGKLPHINSTEPDELIHDLPFPDYLGDASCMSSSGIKKLLKSPRHYIAEVMGFLNNDEDKNKQHFRFGRAAHLMVLEPAKFRETYLVEPEFQGLTKDGRPSSRSADAIKAKKDWWATLHPDAVVVKRQEMEALTYMVESLMSHSQARNLLQNGRPEVTGKFTHKGTGVRCRIRPDYLTTDNNGKLYITDFKTTKDPSPALFAHDAARFKYNLQLAFYADGIAQITGQQIESVALLALEHKAPYNVAVYWINEDDLATGRQWYEYGLMTYVRCVEKREWPGIQGEGQMLNLPNWTQHEQFPQFDWKQEDTK